MENKKSGAKEKIYNVIAFAGNPNVGKSTIFNELTGLNQHTGNWAGKTVELAEGFYTYKNKEYKLVDLPGTYSLMANSKEEEVARDFICSDIPDKIVVVCDATCLERNLNLVLQTLEITDNVIVCVNLIDEAENKKISVDFKKLEEILNVSVIPVCARTKKGISELKEAISNPVYKKAFKVNYGEFYESVINDVENVISNEYRNINSRWFAIKLLCNDISLENEKVENIVLKTQEKLEENNIDLKTFKDKIAEGIVLTAEGIYIDTVNAENEKYNEKDRKTDKILTSKWLGYPMMLLFLGVIFFITIEGANYPSELLSQFFLFIENKLIIFAEYINAPKFLSDMLISGVYKVVSWVVAVMLPPMAIFFPLFTLLEDVGFLPRIAFNLDRAFKKCNSCGKQSLTMCMGFGCNAVGVTGARIIDSERERIIAMVTNSFVPCNGRFPTIIAIISMFFISSSSHLTDSLLSSFLLTGVIIFSVAITFIVSKILSVTFLKGNPSSYTLELPPFRRPQIIKVIVRSVFDRTLFVLGRAVAVAVPAGGVIWIVANIDINGLSLIKYISSFLDPFGKLIGLDGVIVLAFILGFPANEIVVPVMLMAYMSTGTLVEYNSLSMLKNVLVQNGWNMLTALNMIIFTLLHFPCSTTMLTIKKETGSIKWTVISFLIPLIAGTVICMITTFIASLV